MFGDPFEQVGRLAQQVRVTRRLDKESRQPDCDRSKAMRVKRLMEKGEVEFQQLGASVQTTAWEFESRSNAVLSGTTCIQQPQPVYPDGLC